MLIMRFEGKKKSKQTDGMKLIDSVIDYTQAATSNLPQGTHLHMGKKATLHLLKGGQKVAAAEGGYRKAYNNPQPVAAIAARALNNQVKDQLTGEQRYSHLLASTLSWFYHQADWRWGR
jgi:hypothetical protein